MVRKASSDKEAKELREKVEKLEAENKELTTSLQRTMADFDNYRKRAEKERQESSQAANSELIMQLFPLLDNFHRAAEHAPTIDISDEGIPPLTEEEFSRIHAYFEGMRQIERQLEQTLQSVGLRRIETISQPYDHRTMEAISYEPHPELPADTVIDEVEGGYRLGDKVIRPAKVRVSKGTD